MSGAGGTAAAASAARAATLDAHQHFWRFVPEQYGWIDDAMGALRRDFLPGDLAPALAACGVSGTVAVQARQATAETEWLLALAAAHPWIRGVVGWLPLAAPDVERDLEWLAADPRLRAVRHVLHDEADDAYMLGADFGRGLSLLHRHGLAYDLLIRERHLPHAIRLVDRHPAQRFVLDHAAKPRLRDGTFDDWARGIRTLAEREHCCCKVSGLATEADWERWTPEQLRPCWDTLLEAFGPRRLAFGSDWPVCLLATSYERWHETVRGLAAGLSADERGRLFGATAAEMYGLDG